MHDPINLFQVVPEKILLSAKGAYITIKKFISVTPGRLVITFCSFSKQGFCFLSQLHNISCDKSVLRIWNDGYLCDHVYNSC